ncbi:MAG: Zn-dependent exopeptidase M28 [Chloroflexaceae bacterium]|nr:Zn-dependent exopeptidase M28 [Chloroflexaceae bacterium]
MRIAPTGEVRRRLVLIAHTDTNKHRITFRPLLKRLFPAITTGVLVNMVAGGLIHLFRTVGPRRSFPTLYRLSLIGLIKSLVLAAADERSGYVDGANDNASAVACVLGLAGRLQQQPLKQTEVWLAFTGAEEVGCMGMHELLDRYGSQLTDAWFLDLEMVGAGDLVYVTRHTSASYLNGYRPDPHSVALADKAARRNPEMNVTGRDVVTMEEIGALRKRGYRGICLAGVDHDGWLVNWHQHTDNVNNIEPACVERAARFTWEMIQSLDQ